ncbi:MAG: hypothetical protein HY938_04625 [Nitrosomonadales bacterium]|nr:hypothetical protein [Nitrosomonadales bacterium]
MGTPNKYIPAGWAGLLFISALMFSIQDARAVIAFRAASFAGVRSATISYQATGTVVSAASGNVTPTLSSVSLNNLLICLVEQHDNVAISFPAGWTQLYSISTTATHRAAGYYKISAAAEANPLITHPGGNSITARCSTFRGVDPGNPLDVAYAAQYAASSTSVTSGSVTTLSANDWMLYAMHIANSPTITVAPGGTGGVTWTQRYYSSTTLGLDSAVGLYTGPKAVAGAVGPITSTVSLASENHGVLMALRNGSRLSIPLPAGTVAGDVMIAAVATTPSTVTITAPAGWTLIQTVTQATATSNRVATYYRVATASEPASYSWTFSTTHSGAAGGIVSYSGVDNTAPVDVSAGAATASALTHTAPGITTAAAGDMLVTVHEYASGRSWTPPAGMTERVDIASRSASNNGITLEMNELLLGAAGATGAKTATASAAADTGATVSIALRPAVTAPHHIRIEHDGSASNCAPETITIKACANAACTAPHFTLGNVTGITLAATGTGVVWTPANPQTISAAGGGINSGITLARGNAGTATLSITGTPSPAPGAAYECYNTATGTSGDCGLVFSDILSFDVLNQTAGTPQVVNMTVCASSFASTTRTVKFWSTYVNPATGTLAGKVVAGTGNADCATGYSALGTASATPTSLNLAFGAGTSPQATFSLCYPDVGQVKLDARYDGAAGNTPPDAGVVKLGGDNFIAKPDHFSVSAIKCTTANAANCGVGALAMPTPGDNPAAADATGGSFMRAGDAMAAATRFSATITARNALNAVTPNFGRENAPGPEGVRLTSVLVAPGGGVSGLLTCKASATACIVPGGAANFTGGATTITDLAWDEVGIITLLPVIGDADYLGTGALATPTASGNIGRFTPDHFEVNPDAVYPVLVRADMTQATANATGTTAPATVIDVDDTTGFSVGGKVRIPGAGVAGAAFTATVTAVDSIGLTLTLDTAIATTLNGGESVISEWGSYIGEMMKAQFTLTALDRNGNTTQNYAYSATTANNYAKLDPTAAGNPLGLGAVDTAGPTYNLPLDTSLSASGNFAAGSAAISAPLAVTRGAVAVGPYNAVKFGIAPTDADGVKMNAYDLGVFGAAADHASIMDTLVQNVVAARYGRMKVANGYGSDLLSLPVELTAQYWNGATYVTNAEDNDTLLTVADISLGNYQRKAGDTWTTTIGDIANAGIATWQAVLTKPAGTISGKGSVDVSTNAPSYLPGTGRATFGVYKGANEFIFLREDY